MSKFPVREDQLPRVHVDAETVAQWKLEAQEDIAAVLADQASWYYTFDQSNPSFKPMYDRNSTTTGHMRVLPDSATVEYLSRCELHMPLNDLVHGLKCETTSEQRLVYAQLYDDICLDGAILELFEPSTIEDPFYGVSMKWVAFTMPMNATREYLHFEYNCTTRDAQGRRVLVNYRKSPDLTPEQLTDHALGLTRRPHFGISMFCELDDQRVMLTAMGHVASVGSLRRWVLKVGLPVLFHRALNHYCAVNARALAHAGVTAETLAPRRPMPETICHVCHKTFGLRRRKKWCGGCGHAVCRGCKMTIALVKEGSELSPRMPTVRARFCLHCLLYARQKRVKSAKIELQARASARETELSRRDYGGSMFGSCFIDEGSIDGLIDLCQGVDLDSDQSSEYDTADADDDLIRLSIDETDGSEPSNSPMFQVLSMAKASAKAEELESVARAMVEQAALLRSIHKERHSAKVAAAASN